MEYSINKLAKLSGVSSRTLRYYDEIGLLSPRRTSSNGYRIYGQSEVDVLQQILFYRELGVPLEEIKNIIWAQDYDSASALQGHLSALQSKKEQLERLIANVGQTIAASKGEIRMSNHEKFEGFKRSLIEENEKKYGEEIRQKYGEDTVDASNAKLMGLTEAEYQELQDLSQQVNDTLKKALAQGDPASALAQEACDLHRQWLSFSWQSYTKEAHLGLGLMYVEDERFKKYYDDIAVGAAEFLYEALKIYCA